MKQNRKGFSLVELIVVLVIMAIIAALCAPNISAYVQAAKIQNYQTVANNLADELQTQLPQSRYWNWDEVQRNAYGILCSDSGRGVTLDTEKSTDNQKVYQITGASSDAKAVFTVTLTYHDAVKTSQEVKIAVSCDGYDAAKAEQSCSLVLKTNYTDAGAYPMSSTTITTTETRGWGNLDDRVNTKSYWEEWGKTHPENDFTKDATWSGWWTPDTTIVNLTDYVSNSCKFVQFDMPYFCGYHQTNWYPVEYAGSYAFPSMYSLNGAGDGAQYAVTSYSDGSESTWEKIYIYIGDDNNSEDLNFIDKDADGNEIYDSAAMYDHGWVKYSDIFENGRGKFRTDGNLDYIDAFQNKYNSSITVNPDGTFINNTKIKYRVLLRNDSGEESSRGWLYVEGTYAGIGKKCSPEKTNFLVYANNGSQLNDFSDRYEVDKQSWNTSIYMDVSKCGYSVGNQLSITIHNVDADKLIDSMENGRTGEVSIGQNKSYDGYDGVKYGSIQQSSFIYGKPENGGNYWAEKPDASDNSTARIVIVMTYSRYPYLKLEFLSSFWTSGATSTDVDISLKMDYSGGNSSESTINSYTPMLTLNGDNTYTNITLDWTKCDYITDVSKVGIQFDKYPSGFSYDVYSKDYSPLASGQSLTKLMMGSNSKISASAAADQIVHLYCKDVSPEDISCSVIAPDAPVTTTTTTTVTSAETETETSAKTSDTAPETSASTESSTTSTTTTTTTTTVTTTTTTTTAATTVTTSTTPTTASASAASSTSAETTSATETTSASTSSTSASASSSETESTEDTTDTTASATTETSDVVTSVVTGVNYGVSIAIPNHNNLIGIELKFASCGNFPNVKWYFNNYTQYLDIQSKGMLDENNSIYISVNGNADAAMTVQNWNTYDGMGDLVSVKFYYKQSDESGTTPVEEKPSYEENMIVFDGDAFKYNQSYDISKYWFVNSEDSKRVPEQIQIEFAKGDHNCQAELSASQFQTENWSGSGATFAYCKNISGNETDIYTIPSSEINKLSLLKNVSIKLTSYSGNAKVQTIKFIYSNDTATAKFTRIMTRGESISAIFTESISDATNEVATTTPTTTTIPPQTITTTTTTQPIAASENGKNVGLDESSAAGCSITFSEPLFNNSGVCYFTITPKAGYALSNSYTVKVGTEVLSPKNNYNPKTNQWFFWCNKSMTDYTIHVEGISPAA